MKTQIKNQDLPFKKFTVSRLDKPKGTTVPKARQTTMTTSGTTCPTQW